MHSTLPVTRRPGLGRFGGSASQIRITTTTIETRTQNSSCLNHQKGCNTVQGWHEINGHEILRRPAKMTAKKMTANGGKKDLLWPQYVANIFFFVEMIDLGSRGPFNSTVSNNLFATYILMGPQEVVFAPFVVCGRPLFCAPLPM